MVIQEIFVCITENRECPLIAASYLSCHSEEIKSANPARICRPSMVIA